MCIVYFLLFSSKHLVGIKDLTQHRFGVLFNVSTSQAAVLSTSTGFEGPGALRGQNTLAGLMNKKTLLLLTISCSLVKLFQTAFMHALVEPQVRGSLIVDMTWTDSLG